MKITKQVREHIALAVKELDESGRPWELEVGGKHNRLLYVVGGRTLVAILPTSPSDHRAALNFRSYIRKTIR